MRSKIAIIGAGNVGATAAQWIVSRKLGDVVLFDIVEGMPQGKALDLSQAGPIEGFDCRVTGTNDYKETKGSDVVVITAGLPRKPGMSRDELLAKNASIMKEVVGSVVRESPEAILIVVSNPLDAMVYVAKSVSGFPRERVLGMAGVLDTARFRVFVSQEAGVSPGEVDAMVLGGHGDSMVPLKSSAKVAGKHLADVLPAERVEAIVSRTRDAGAEIVGLLKTGSAYYAPGAAVAEMVDAILNDRKKVLPCSALLQGEFGVDGLFIGVPARLGRKGVEGIVELGMDEEEKAAFDRTVSHVRDLTESVRRCLQNG